MAVLSNLWMPRLLLQGRKPKRRKQNNLYNILVWNNGKKEDRYYDFFFYNVYIIFTTIKEKIKNVNYIVFIFQLN